MKNVKLEEIKAKLIDAQNDIKFSSNPKCCSVCLLIRLDMKQLLRYENSIFSLRIIYL